ncbi:putative transcription regulator GNAT family [Helianthus debilis subsp. tardiflorus]
MVGDVNMYMNDLEDAQLGEIEIMIAEPKSRGKGLGKESVLMMLAFAIENHKINTFRAKIGDSNEASLNMFRKLVTLELPVTAEKSKELLQLVGDMVKYS